MAENSLNKKEAEDKNELPKENKGKLTLSVLEPIEKFEMFLLEYEVEIIEKKEEKGKKTVKITKNIKIYREELKTQFNKEKKEKQRLLVDYEHLYHFDPNLAREILELPEVLLKEFNKAMLNALKKIDEDFYKEDPNITIRLYNLFDDYQVNIREISSNKIGKLITLKGILGQCGKAQPEAIEIAYCCNECFDTQLIPQPEYLQKIVKPSICLNNNKAMPHKLKYQPEIVIEEGIYKDLQRVKLQEHPEDVKSPHNPESILLKIHDDLVDVVKPGDFVYVVGILKAVFQTQGLVMKKRMKYYIKVNNILLRDKDVTRIEITDKDKKRIESLKNDPFLLFKLQKSIAPNLVLKDDITEALIYMLASKQPKTTSSYPDMRRFIHVLIVGDPGTAKSRLLESTILLSPRGIYTETDFTKAGLGVGAERDEDMGGFVIKAGLLVLADGGILAIDELDKVHKEDIRPLYSAMASGKLTKAVVGVSTEYKARTSILAACNPKLGWGRYDENKPLWENLDLDIALISRFDLIFVVLDEPDEQGDMEKSGIRKHELNSLLKSPINLELFTKYFTYIRNLKEPTFESEAFDLLQKYYVEMRGSPSATDEENITIPITLRQFDTLLRLGIARARIFQRDKVIKEDAEAVLRLHKSVMSEFGFDEVSGKFDVLGIMTGTTASERKENKSVETLLKELFIKNPHKTFTLDDIFTELKGKYDNERTVEGAIRSLVISGFLYEPKTKKFKKLS